MRAARQLAYTVPMFELLDYGSKIEQVLKYQAEVSGILKHSGEVGSLRELFVREFLSRFLPRSIVVGHGEIVDGSGGRSKQQDVVLYRGNFPVIHTLGEASLFLAEGVLATIEVKSKLDSREVVCVASNIASVRALRPTPLGVSVKPRRYLGGAPGFLTPMPPAEAVARIAAGMSPGQDDFLLHEPSERIRTYLFALQGVGDRHLNASWARVAPDSCPDCAIVLGRSVGIRPADDTLSPTTNDVGFEMVAHKAPLGWMLAHLWRGVLGRPERLPPLRPYLATS